MDSLNFTPRLLNEMRFLLGFLCFSALSSTMLRAAEKDPTQRWTNCGWGGGGLYQSAIFHPTKPGVIYMSGDVDGVYKTENAGKDWRLINEGLASYEIYSLAIDPKNPETVYAVTTLGLSKSMDGGQHWVTSPDTGPKHLGIYSKRNKSIRPLAVDPNDGNIVYAGTPLGKIYRSGDGTQTWTLVYELKNPGTIYSVTVNPHRSAQILAATETAGIILSNDAGLTWSELNTPKEAAHVTVDPHDGNTFYGAFMGQGVQKSVDQGQTWIACGPDQTGQARIIEVVVSPAAANKVYCVASSGWSGKFYSSSDGGQTWKGNSRFKPNYKENPTSPDDYKVNGLLGFSRISSLSISPANPDQLFVSANWRSALSEDGGESWFERDKGADISCITDIQFHGDKVYATVMDEGLLVSKDGGVVWRQLWPRAHKKELSGHAWRVSVTEKKGGPRIVSTSSPWDKAPKNNGVVISEDGGKSYKLSDTGLPNYRPKKNVMWGEGYMRALAVDPRDAMVLYAGIDGDAEAGKSGGGIFKSEDGGYTWRQLPCQPGSRRMFYGLAVDPTDSKRIYWGAVGKDGGLYRSDDAGNSWKLVFEQESAIFNVLVDKDGTVYCPGKNLWRSNDHGDTWTMISNFTDKLTLVGLQVHPDNPQIIWVSATDWSMSTRGAIYKTTDGGATWSDITGDIPYRKPIVLRYNKTTNELWAGGVGLFKTQP